MVVGYAISDVMPMSQVREKPLNIKTPDMSGSHELNTEAGVKEEAPKQWLPAWAKKNPAGGPAGFHIYKVSAWLSVVRRVAGASRAAVGLVGIVIRAV